MMKDARDRVQDLADALGSSESRITDPFVSMYEAVFQMTMRRFGAQEIADDMSLCRKAEAYYKNISFDAAWTAIVFPWLPSWAAIKRTYNGGRLFMMFKAVADERAKTGRRRDDAMQFLFDQGDQMIDFIRFSIGAIFAGYLNTSVNVANQLCYLAINPDWLEACRAELLQAIAKHSSGSSGSVIDKLQTLPLDAWEKEMPVLYMVLRESIRLNLPGTLFRKNIGDTPVAFGDNVVPPGAFASFHIATIHQNPDIYTDPLKFDPGRYTPERAEDKKEKYGYVGWGVSRHPCLGKRFAELESKMLLAFFIMRFDFELVDEKGREMRETAPLDLNAHSATKPTRPMLLRYRLRRE
ncbi:hypothetical protein MRB53_042103 [Persea americana]|nr:hypothetical protein MRB53_042103 [Persea americana]